MTTTTLSKTFGYGVETITYKVGDDLAQITQVGTMHDGSSAVGYVPLRVVSALVARREIKSLRASGWSLVK